MAIATETTTPVSRNQTSFLRALVGQELILFLCIIALFVIVGSINPRYIAERNLSSIFLGNAYIAVAAIGMSMVIISGNIDISVGSLIGVLATVSGSLAVNGYPIIISWLVPLNYRRCGDRHHGFHGCLSTDSVHRRIARHAQYFEGRVDQCHGRRLDHRSAGRLCAGANATLRNPHADLLYGPFDHRRCSMDAL